MRLRLRVNGCVFPAAQVSDVEVVLREAAVLPDGPAEIVAEIDGREHRWPVIISDRHLAREVVPIAIGSP